LIEPADGAPAVAVFDSATRRRAARVLGRGEHRFRALAETIQAAVFMHDDGKTTYVNPAAARLSGYTRQELLGMVYFWQLIHPDSRPRLMEMYAAHLRGEFIPTGYEVKIVTKSGESRWVQFTFDWVDIQPNRRVMLGTAFDITERKEAEEAFRQKNDQLQAMFNAFPDLLFRLDRRGTILEYMAGPDWELYHPPEEFMGKRMQSVLPRNVGTLFLQAITNVGETQRPTTIEYGLRLPPGQRQFEARLLPFQQDQILVLVRDITERSQAEEALRQSEARYRALYKDNPAMYFTLDAKGRVLSVNDFGAAQLGYTVDELVGKPVLSVFHRQDRKAVRQHLAGCLAHPGQTAVWQFRKVCKDGSVIWVEELARASQDAEGRPIVLVVCRDITDRRQTENSLRENEARLRAFAHAVPDIAFILDEDGLYVEVLGLPQRSDLLYSQGSGLRDKRLHDVLPKKSADRFLSVIRKTIETGEPQVLEYELKAPGGHQWFEGRTAPLPLQGKKRMVVWLAQDITERKRMEEALIALREELDRKAEHAFRRGNRYGLTFRELTVLQLVVAGKSDKEVGLTLGISRLTANKHVANMLKKMKVASRAAAGAVAIRDKLIS
jgi:PAS domain S-box-containing protein